MPNGAPLGSTATLGSVVGIKANAKALNRFISHGLLIASQYGTRTGWLLSLSRAADEGGKK